MPPLCCAPRCSRRAPGRPCPSAAYAAVFTASCAVHAASGAASVRLLLAHGPDTSSICMRFGALPPRRHLGEASLNASFELSELDGAGFAMSISIDACGARARVVSVTGCIPPLQ